MPAAAVDRNATIGLREAADRLGVHYMTAYRYVRSGRLAAHKSGDEWRVRTADLDALRPSDPTSRGRRAAAPQRGPPAWRRVSWPATRPGPGAWWTRRWRRGRTPRRS